MPELPATESDSHAPALGAALRALQAGSLIAARYRLVQPLGRGGMSEVWEAIDETLDNKVRALKFLAEPLAQDLLAVAELKAEVVRCQELSHPNIIRVHDFVEDRNHGVVAISMELAREGSINVLRADRPNRWFEPEELREWVEQLCSALDYAHREARIVHRDLKPANLLLDDRRRVKVADFGIARALSESFTRITNAEGPTNGTPAYMSPEQARGKMAKTSDDIYALGATLYDLLTGRPPYLGAHYALILHQLLDAHSVPPTVAERRRELMELDAPIPDSWERALAACLSKNPANRPTTARDVAAMLLGSGAGRHQAPVPRESSSQGIKEVQANEGPSKIAKVHSPFPNAQQTELRPIHRVGNEQVPSRKGRRIYAIATAACLASSVGGYFVWQGIRHPKNAAANSSPPATAEPGIDLHPVATDQLVSAEEKALVLSQINLLTTLTPEKRDRLRISVNRAREIRKVVEIRFANGQTDIPVLKEVEKLLTTVYVQKKYREDPTAVFMVLGFCDSDTGDTWEREISEVRAMNVVRIMKSIWKVYNVIHAIPMGNGRMTSRESIDPKKAGTAEIWTVLP